MTRCVIDNWAFTWFKDWRTSCNNWLEKSWCGCWVISMLNLMNWSMLEVKCSVFRKAQRTYGKTIWPHQRTYGKNISNNWNILYFLINVYCDSDFVFLINQRALAVPIAWFVKLCFRKRKDDKFFQCDPLISLPLVLKSKSVYFLLLQSKQSH